MVCQPWWKLLAMIDECCIRQCVHPLHSDMKMKYLTDIKIIYESLLEDTQIKKQEREVKWNKKTKHFISSLFFLFYFKLLHHLVYLGQLKNQKGRRLQPEEQMAMLYWSHWEFWKMNQIWWLGNQLNVVTVLLCSPALGCWRQMVKSKCGNGEKIS